VEIRDRRSYSHIEQEYKTQAALFKAQPNQTQRFLNDQASGISEALLQNASLVRFRLPDCVIEPDASGITPGGQLFIPDRQRQQLASSYIGWFSQTYLDNALGRRLGELEQSHDPGVATAAHLLRYSIAAFLIHQRLPSGRTVKYLAVDGDEIPSLPSQITGSTLPALVAASDAITEEHTDDEVRDELQTPYTPWARCFYLPVWIALDERDRLLVGSNGSAEGCLASMRSYVSVLHCAIDLAPYMVADPVYQQKRYGMLGQLINQGRSYARFQTEEIIAAIQRRAEANDLNRGLSLSLPYFDDQTLGIELDDFVVIPAGRVMFLPSLVVLAAIKEQSRVAQDISLNLSTRKHLLGNLKLLERAFR
jgi:hypothetical protein